MTVRPIHVTGTTGYLGGRIMEYCAQHDIPVRAVRIPPKHGRIKAMLPEDAVVIHCAAIVPHSHQEADEYTDVMGSTSAALLSQLISAQPAFTVFPSTRETEGVYAKWKHRAELLLGEGRIRSVILRFPGLFGPPRRNGVVYATARAMLGRDWHKGQLDVDGFAPVPSDWTTMHVMDAAERCVEAALAQKPRTTPRICSDPRIDEFLDFVRG